MNAIDQLLSVANAYGSAVGIELSTVSWRALGDTRKLGALEAGKDIQVKRCDAAMQWFAENWPSDAPWPADVPRPPSQIEGKAA